MPDFRRDSSQQLLGFSAGSLITNITTCRGEEGLWKGDHRGDKEMLLPMSHVRLLTKEEMDFVTDLVRTSVCGGGDSMHA